MVVLERRICMTIKDILTITGGNTKVMIFSVDKDDRYIRLWYGIVDDICFPHVPYGYYDVEHMTVNNEEDILQLYFEYPELSKDYIDIINKEAIGYSYPTEWIEKLFIKYRDWEYVREILTTKSKEETYEEIKIIFDEDLVEEDNVVTVCYGKEETWASREEAEEHFLNYILRTDAGSERDRYVNILCKLKYGEYYCTDSNKI